VAFGGVLAASLGVGCGPLGADDGGCGPGRFVTEVLSASYGPGQSFGQNEMPAIVYGPPHGGGCCQGSVDVVSLGNGGEIVLGFAQRIVDGPGPDLVVFENPFETADGSTFAELATVSVSADGVSWTSFPCEATEPPYGSCAGVGPVYLDGDEGPIDPRSAGGDPFDLADVGVPSARFVRIVDRPDIAGFAGVFDLDAVGIVNGECP
jgi:hypothetical protein